MPKPRRNDSGLTGLLLIDKEPGWTSHDVVAKVRGITNQRRIGHTGTLDPSATGLLVLCLGQATRLVEYIIGADKRYVGEIALGVETTTDDGEGEVTARHDPPDMESVNLAELEQQFTGEIEQVPPAFSAVKVEGRRSYAVARAGGEPGLQPRTVRVYELRLEPRPPDRLGIDVRCGSGTYVRALARDIGRAIGCGAHLASLRRTEVGRFHVDSAITVGQLQSVANAGHLDDVIWAADEALGTTAAAIVADERAKRLRGGQPLTLSRLERRYEGLARVYSASGAFVAVGWITPTGQLRPEKVLNSPGS
ncbi:MAG: tRNA pseudouridine(55) synthase TruB [Dehalococcoidia bacterium]